MENLNLKKETSLDAAEISNIKLDKMRYQKNSLSYIIGFAAIIASVFAAFVLLNSLQPGAYSIFKILLNILILLFGFMCCENVKNYREKSGFMLIGIGIVCGLRIFFGPLLLFINFSKFQKLDKSAIDYTEKLNEVKKWLGSTIVSEQKTGYLTPNGYVRAIIAIILLGIAAACFIASGLICIKKSRTLNKYIDSLKEN